jgi:exopolysaccharide biosynthesis polyprenyl glycosylphosphotransferase
MGSGITRQKAYQHPEKPMASKQLARQRVRSGEGDRRKTQLTNQPPQLPFSSPQKSRSAHWLLLCGETGGIIVSLLTITAASHLGGVAADWLLEAMISLILIRIFASHTKRHRAVLNARILRHHLGTLMLEETAVSLAFLAACFIMGWPIDRFAAGIFVLLNFAGQTGLYLITRAVSRSIAALRSKQKHLQYERHAVIAGTGPKAYKVADALMHAPELGTHLLGFLDYHKTGLWRYHDAPLIGHPDCLERIIIDGQVDALFIALEPEDIPKSEELFRVAERTGVDIYLMPDIYQPTLARPRLAQLDGFSTLVYRTTPENRISLICKKVVDRIGALIGVILASPIMLAAALAIKLDSPGPILFKQERSGLNGKRFPLYKFRTMCIDAEKRKADLAAQNEMSGPVFKIKADPRITHLGRFLRKYSIDELPQLFNILHGDMSLVGPRPPLPSEVTKFEGWQRRKLSVKPGLTCLWQVNGRNSIDFEDWMRLDLQYIDNWSLLLDAKILLKTVPTVLKGSGH